MALLGRLLPFMVAEYVPVGDEFWANYLVLLHVVDLLMAPEISEDEVGYLDLMIKEHHTTFIEHFRRNQSPQSYIIWCTCLASY